EHERRRAAVEEPGAEPEPPELPPDRALVHRARVAAEGPVAGRARLDEGVSRQVTVLERERDPLAHERIDARRVPDEERARRSDDGLRRQRADRERLP